MKRLASAALALFTLLTALGGCVGEIDSHEEVGNETAYSLGNPDLRIAIVGAGASGLTAAHTLRALGYENITIFEKEGDVGGKIQSFKIGETRGELGAVFASPDYELTLDLADEYGITYLDYDSARFVLDKNPQGQYVKMSFQQFLLNRYSVPQIQQAIVKYAGVLQQFASIEGDGFVGLHPDMYLTFDKFAQKHGIVPVAELARSLWTGFGYDYYENIPAAYVMKLLPWLVKIGPTGLESPPYFVFPDGYQAIWKAVAGDFNVKTFSKVTKIERSDDGGPVKLTINYNIFNKQTFDAVIVSAPLNVVPEFLDVTPAEKALFKKVETSRYFVTLFAAANLPLGETVFVHKSGFKENINHASVWGNPGGELPVFIAYQLADKYISASEITATLALDILTLGKGLFLTHIIRKEWEYFPRVNGANLENGFYESVDALQGQRGVYFVGSTLAFETVERTARFARSLVQDHFPAASAVVAP